MTKLLLIFVPGSGARAEAVSIQLEALASVSSCVVDGPLEFEGSVPSTDSARFAMAKKVVEHALHGARTREGIARAKAEGRRIGRPPGYSPEIRARIVSDRDSGASWGVIGHRYGIPRSSARTLYERSLRAGALHTPSKRKGGPS